ncbi:MAG: hypothetical protein AB1792_03350 [Candidatus Zixiibacteriota bacterium]
MATPIPSIAVERPADSSASPQPKRLHGPTSSDVQLRRLRRAASGFEAIFLQQLLSTMQRTIGSRSNGSGYGGDVMIGVAQEKMAESVADQGGFGLGRILFESLRRRVVPDSAERTPVTPPDKAPIIPWPSDEPSPRPLTSETKIRPLAPGQSTSPTPRPIDREGR